jgi:hypothetical protein
MHHKTHILVFYCHLLARWSTAKVSRKTELCVVGCNKESVVLKPWFTITAQWHMRQRNVARRSQSCSFESALFWNVMLKCRVGPAASWRSGMRTWLCATRSSLVATSWKIWCLLSLSSSDTDAEHHRYENLKPHISHLPTLSSTCSYVACCTFSQRIKPTQFDLCMDNLQNLQ